MTPHFTQQLPGIIYEVGSGPVKIVVVNHLLAPILARVASDPYIDSAELNKAVHEHAIYPGVGIPSDS